MVLGLFLLAALVLLVLTSFALAAYVLSEQNYKLLWLTVPYTIIVLLLSFLLEQSMGWPVWTIIVIAVLGFALYAVVGISFAVYYGNMWKTKHKMKKLNKA